MTYAATVRFHQLTVDRIEGRLDLMPAGATLSRSDLRAAAGPDASSEDVVLLIARSLVGLGVLQEVRSGWSLNGTALRGTAEFRRGVRMGIATSPARDDEAIVLARAPIDAAPAVHDAVGAFTSDLRFVLLDLIASAQSELLLASPFWDDETVDELRKPLQGRLDMGVQLILLGRDTQRGPIQRLWRSLSAPSDLCRLYGWYEAPHGQGDATTFHLKALIQDRGRAAYVGSANFTASSLRSRMELGLRLTGAPAVALSAIMHAVVANARRAAE